jgi:hypothetical protein
VYAGGCVRWAGNFVALCATRPDMAQGRTLAVRTFAPVWYGTACALGCVWHARAKVGRSGLCVGTVSAKVGRSGLCVGTVSARSRTSWPAPVGDLRSWTGPTTSRSPAASAGGTCAAWCLHPALRAECPLCAVAGSTAVGAGPDRSELRCMDVDGCMRSVLHVARSTACCACLQLQRASAAWRARR